MSAFQKIDCTIGPQQEGMRLDLALVAIKAGDFSRRKIRAIIDVGGCYINGKRVRMASKPVRTGDRITLQYSEGALKEQKKSNYTITAADILFHESDLIGVNKMAGVPAQATLDQSVNHLGAYLSKYLQENRITGKSPMPVHRLDKDTTGVMMFALTPKTMDFLTDQFKEKTVRKTYIAVCFGTPEVRKFEVNCFLSPIDKKTGNVTSIRSGGRPSHTAFEVMATNEKLGICLMRCHPTTGRSHQIRVHLTNSGLPIVGDKRYGGQGNPSRRLSEVLQEQASHHHFLHALELEFTMQNGAKKKLSAPLPELMISFLNGSGLTWKQ